MVNEKDYFKEGMDEEEFDKALKDYVAACKKAKQHLPIWVRMQLDEEKVTPPDPDLERALKEIDKEFGVKSE